MAQQARNVAMFFDAQERKPTHLLRERDTKFTQRFEAILESEEIEVKPSPYERRTGTLMWHGAPHPADQSRPFPLAAFPTTSDLAVSAAGQTPPVRTSTRSCRCTPQHGADHSFARCRRFSSTPPAVRRPPPL